MTHEIKILNDTISLERWGPVLNVIANTDIALESDRNFVLPINVKHPTQNAWGFYYPQIANGITAQIENFTVFQQRQFKIEAKKMNLLKGSHIGYFIFFKNAPTQQTQDLNGTILTQSNRFISYSGLFYHTSEFYLNTALHFKQQGQQIYLFGGKSNFTRNLPLKGQFINDQLVNNNNNLYFSFENTDLNHFNLKIGNKFVIFQQQQMRLSTVPQNQIISMDYPQQTLGFDKFSTVQLNYYAFSTTDGTVKVGQTYQLSIYMGLHSHAQFKINEIPCQIVLQAGQLHLTQDLTQKYAITILNDTQFAISFEDGKFLSVTQSNGQLIWTLTQQIFYFVEALSQWICFRWGIDNFYISAAFGENYLSVRPYDKQYVLKYNRRTRKTKIGEQQITFMSTGALVFNLTGLEMELQPTTEQFTRLTISQHPVAVINSYIRKSFPGTIFRALSFPQFPELSMLNFTKVYLKDWTVEAGILMKGIPPANKMIQGYIIGTSNVQKGYLFMNYRFKHEGDITCTLKNAQTPYMTSNTQIIFKISNIIENNGQFTAQIECFDNINRQKRLQIQNGTIKTYNGTGQGTLSERIYLNYRNQIDDFDQIQMRAYSGGLLKVFQAINDESNPYQTVITKLNLNEYTISTVTYIYQDASSGPFVEQLVGPFGMGYTIWQNIQFPPLKPRIFVDCETQSWHPIRVPVGNLILKRTPPGQIQWWIFCVNPLICGRVNLQPQGYWSIMEN